MALAPVENFRRKERVGRSIRQGEEPSSPAPSRRWRFRC